MYRFDATSVYSAVSRAFGWFSRLSRTSSRNCSSEDASNNGKDICLRQAHGLAGTTACTLHWQRSMKIREYHWRQAEVAHESCELIVAYAYRYRVRYAFGTALAALARK